MSKFYLSIIILLAFVQNTFSQADFSYDGDLCQNNSIHFTDKSVIPVSSWQWDFGDGSISTIQNPTHTYLDTGSHNIELTIVAVSNSNSYKSSQTIKISANPQVGFTIDSTQVYYSTYSRVFIDTSIIYNPTNKFIWNFGDNSSSISIDSSSVMYKYKEEGTYEVWLKVVDSKNCMDSTSSTVSIHNRFYIPNIFTPNGDSKNDLFVVTSNGNTLFSIEIFSRWGNIVFTRSGYQQIVWDGKLPEGTLVKPGTYFYVIKSESGDTNYEPEKGFITVLY